MSTDTRWRAFNSKWFAKHQARILAACNAPFVGRWTRAALGIDAPPDSVVVGIYPNSVTWRRAPLSGGRLVLTTDFRTHRKFAKRMYFAFEPIWRAMHCVDIPLERLNPAWGFGFSTLTTFYSETGNSVDGWCARHSVVGESWAAMRGGNGTNADDGDTSATNIIYMTGSDFNWLYRIRAGFDTSAIGSGSTILSGTFSGYGVGGMTTTWGSVCLCNVSPGSPTAIVAADYQTFGTTLYSGDVWYRGGVPTWVEDAYNGFTLNAAGLAAISKTGTTEIGLRDYTYDLLNVEPAASSYFGLKMACAEAGAVAPKLVVTYDYVAPHIPKIIVC